LVIPVYDEDGLIHGVRPWVMWSLLVINVMVLVFLWLLSDESAQIFAYNFGVVPAFITGAVDIGPLDLLMPPALTLLTYMFLHGSWVHLAGNMIFLWVFGDDIEAALGHLRFLLFYLLCGISGALAHIASDPGGIVPLVGASGAVSGVAAAYLMLHPWAHVTVLVFGLMTVRIHALWLLGVWIAWQVLNLLLLATGGISYWSHLGGLAAGAALVVILRQPGVKLFRAHIDRRPPIRR
jgi:membrane associated rhomboid family serine protease